MARQKAPVQSDSSPNLQLLSPLQNRAELCRGQSLTEPCEAHGDSQLRVGSRRVCACHCTRKGRQTAGQRGAPAPPHGPPAPLAAANSPSLGPECSMANRASQPPLKNPRKQRATAGKTDRKYRLSVRVAKSGRSGRKARLSDSCHLVVRRERAAESASPVQIVVVQNFELFLMPLQKR